MQTGMLTIRMCDVNRISLLWTKCNLRNGPGSFLHHRPAQHMKIPASEHVQHSNIKETHIEFTMDLNSLGHISPSTFYLAEGTNSLEYQILMFNVVVKVARQSQIHFYIWTKRYMLQ